MKKKNRKVFACQDKLVPYRFHKGVYEAHYRREGLKIFASAKDFEELKRRFSEKLSVALSQPKSVPIKTHSTPAVCQQVQKKLDFSPMFTQYIEQWLSIKKYTVKESTYKEYERICNYNLIPTFGNYTIEEMTRPIIQAYLFSIVNEGKHRTAEKIQLTLVCIFDLIVEDLGMVSPMKKITLPYYETKKGNAFTKEEERILVDFCIKNNECEAASALLVLLYFGLRRSELKSIRIENESLICITAKTKKGRNEVERIIPFTPVFKRVLPYVDFEKARNTNVNTIQTTLKRLLPSHHTHELRYTFITRAKESGCNQEIVMLWAGHSFDKDVKTSAVDRGYTDYSMEYMRSEAQKIDYAF
jgi:integrase